VTSPLLLLLLAADSQNLRILQTTDMHGYLQPYDYFSARPANRGLAKVATLIRQARAGQPNALLIDGGDTIQGSPLEAVHQMAVRAGRTTQPDPMILAMNHLRYDGMVVGNHEFNYGLKNLRQAQRQSRFPWLSANTRGPAGFAPYLFKKTNGVRVAVIGLTTGGIPHWEKPENYAGLTWEDQIEATRRTLQQLKAKRPDVVVLAVHGGLDRDLKTGRLFTGQLPNDNVVAQLAEAFPQVDLILYGHSHIADPGSRIGNVLIVQARNWAQSLAQVDLTLERAGRGWKVTEKRSQLLPVTDQVAADPEILRLTQPYHDATEAYLKTPVAQSAADLTGTLARYQDSALVDAIHEVQLHYTKADVSLASLFQLGIRIRKGPVTVREMAALYLFDNELYTVEGDGRMLREALENAARFFLTCPEPTCTQGSLINQSVPGFNFDTAQGVSYEIDLNAPAGQRIRNLRYRGAPLRDDQPLKLAVNNYRAAGSGGYEMFRRGKITWRSGREIRDMLIEYFTEKKMLPAAPDGNWRITPATALDALSRSTSNR
jgi:2',3'-cyclic-nucleotide 2'-phosphodiesterase / 3'-nucleotidase